MKIISGGQTGVGQGAMDFTLNHDWPCGDWSPPGKQFFHFDIIQLGLIHPDDIAGFQAGWMITGLKY